MITMNGALYPRSVVHELCVARGQEEVMKRVLLDGRIVSGMKSGMLRMRKRCYSAYGCRCD